MTPTPTPSPALQKARGLAEFQKKAAGLPWAGCNHVKDHSFDKKCRCRQATLWSTPLDTIICEKYENRDGSGPDPVTRECELNTMSFILELANAFPSIHAELERVTAERDVALKGYREMREALKVAATGIGRDKNKNACWLTGQAIHVHAIEEALTSFPEIK